MRDEQLKLLIDQIPDQRIRARNALNFLLESGNTELLREYARQYLEVFDMADGEKGSYNFKHPGLTALGLVPKEERAGFLAKIREIIIRDAGRYPEKTIGIIKFLCESEKTSFPELEAMVLGNEMFGCYPRVPKDKIDKALEYAANRVFSEWKGGEEVQEYVPRLFSREDFQTRYAEHPVARKIASAIVVGACKGKIYGLDLKGIERLVAVFKPEINASTLVQDLLGRVRLERAESISRLLEYSIGASDLGLAEESVNQRLKDRIGEGNIASAVDLQVQLEVLARYKEHGLSIEDIPRAEIYGDYGKFIIVNYKEGNFLRGAKPRESHHSDILGRFAREIMLRGFDRDETQESDVSGAHYSIEKGIMTIKDKSIDFGECDKNLARKLMSSVFSGEIRTDKDY